MSCYPTILQVHTDFDDRSESAWYVMSLICKSFFRRLARPCIGIDDTLCECAKRLEK